MLSFKLALRNLARRPRRSLTLLLIMAASIFLLFVGNAILDGTSAGIEGSFLRSFTGDLAVRAIDSESYSLFGSETPVIGELAKLPELAPYRELESYLRTKAEIERLAPQTSGAAYLEFSGYRMAVPLFGISGEQYFSALDGLSITRGRPLAAGERGLLMSDSRAAEIERLTGRLPELGDLVQLTVATDSSFRIRAVPLVGITSYPAENATLERIILLDAGTLRALYGMGSSMPAAAKAPEEAVTLMGSGLDELFSEAADDTDASGESLDRAGIEAEIARKAAADPEDGVAGPWHFLILRLRPGVKTEAFRARLNAEFAARGWPAEAVGWREAAGSSALFVYWLRVIFNAGIVVVSFAGLIVVVNALVSGVLERTGEIGSMRALGAQRSFVRRLFALETMVLALAACVLGTGLGIIAVEALSRRGLALANPFLIQLFGGARLKPSYGVVSILRSVAASLLMGGLAWIYPVRLALKIEPVEAMRRQE